MKNVEDIVVFLPERIYFCTFLHCLYVRNTKVTFAEKTEIENKQIKKHEYLIHTLSDKFV